MKYWIRIRNFFYLKYLENKMRTIKAKRIITNYKNAKTIGILYDSSPSYADAIIKKFAQTLCADGKTVSVLAFLNDSKIDHKPDIDLFNKKALNWILVPTHVNIDKFTAQNFDLLIACIITENLPLEYVVRTSNAKWRVGSYAENKTDHYELMINLDGKDDLSYFLQQTLFFLNKIDYDSK